MKKFILTFVFVIVATLAAMAQQISVVSTTGATTLYRTLQDAIEGASNGSVIYLPGGGFQISDEVKITNKKLTIIGIGHYVNSGNPDGNTTISGNLFFNEGSSGSAVIGCYITGNVYIGEGGASVNDVLIRQCNLNSVQVTNNSCVDIEVTQNYIRGTSNFGGSNGQVTNNVLHSIQNIENGLISYNIILGAYTYNSGWVYLAGDFTDVANIGANTTRINNNVLNPNVPYATSQGHGSHTYVYGSNNQCVSNLTLKSGFGERSIVLESVEWDNIFENYNGGAIIPASDFHFTDDYKQYENQVGIYGGSGFNMQVTSVPYIIYKDVSTETDAHGMLKVRIRVKANQ